MQISFTRTIRVILLSKDWIIVTSRDDFESFFVLMCICVLRWNSWAVDSIRDSINVTNRYHFLPSQFCAVKVELKIETRTGAVHDSSVTFQLKSPVIRHSISITHMKAITKPDLRKNLLSQRDEAHKTWQRMGRSERPSDQHVTRARKRERRGVKARIRRREDVKK